MTAIADRLIQGFQAQERGELRDAAEFFVSVLNDEPENVNALQLLGLIHLKAGRFEKADRLISKAIELCPEVPELHNNRGLTRLGQGRLRESEFDILNAIRLKPEYPEAFNNLGLVASRLERSADAEAAFIRAIGQQPNFPSAFNNLAATVLKQGRAADAEACCKRAIALRPVYPEAEMTLGLALEQLGRFEEAEACFRRSLADKPHPLTWTGLGRLLRFSGRAADAEQCFRAALELTENSDEAYRQLGWVLLEQGNIAEAEAAGRKALEIGGESAEVQRLVGSVFREQGHLQEVETCYLRALELERENAEAHRDLAHLHLLTGRWQTGWKGHEWRSRCRHAQRQPFEQPRWDGSPLDGKTILLWSEAAFEDTLQFVRYVHLVKARGGRVILRAPEALGSLLRPDYLGIDRVILEDQAIPQFETHASLVSLPRIFGTTPDTVPTSVSLIPPLEFDSTTWSFWQEKLDNFTGVKVGIVWNADSSHSPKRSINPAAFSSLGSVSGISLISLQKGAKSTELPRGIGYLDRSFDEATWVDMAAIVSGLDLVIAVDSPIAHLAGAQGIPVWLALSFIPDWRWLLGRDDSPWYSNMRLFRQPSPGNWDAVFKRLAVELEQGVRTRTLGFASRRRQGDIDFSGGINLDVF